MRGGSRRATPLVIPYHSEEDPRSPHFRIEIAAFGYNEQGRPRCNGAFYHQVEEVLVFYGLSTGSTGSTSSTA